jgi:lambda repressor-like predicted transcriptional regulator
MSARLRALKPFTATAAVKARMRELGITAADLADRAGVSAGTLRYFGLLAHDRKTLERLSVALDWPQDQLSELWSGEQPH